MIFSSNRREREKYAKHRNKAQKYPSKYLSVIIDGMDQEKTSLPHIISNPSSMAGSYMLETHVTGIRTHGRSTMMAIDCGQFPHDSNLTIEILLRLFADLQVYIVVLDRVGIVGNLPFFRESSHQFLCDGQCVQA